VARHEVDARGTERIHQRPRVTRGDEGLARFEDVIARVAVDRDPDGAFAAGDAAARGVPDRVDLAAGKRDGDGSRHGVSPVAFANGMNILDGAHPVKR
jgi:hypothetical protein